MVMQTIPRRWTRSFNSLLRKEQAETATDYVFILTCGAAAVLAVVYFGGRVLEIVTGGSVRIL
jgi:hypothetical protein